MAKGDAEAALALSVSVDGIAAIFKTTKQNIGLWVKAGMPKASAGNYNIAECVSWRLQRVAERKGDGDLNEERRLLIVEQRRGQEIDNAVRLGELLPADRVQTLFQTAAAVFASQVDALPARIAPRAAAVNDQRIIERMIADECRAIRSAASQAFADLRDAATGFGDVEPAADEERRGVGGSA